VAQDRPRFRKPSLAERRAQRATVDDPEEVLSAAARFLEARPRSVAEVRRRLGTAGYRGDLVEAAVARLVDLGFLDDGAFAQAWVESRDRAHPRGEAALRRELLLRGVGREDIEAALEVRRQLASAPPGADGSVGSTAAVAASDPDEEAADRLLRARLRPILREPDPRRRLGRAYALLARHGFAPDVCARVSRAVIAAEAADDA
jgi:regulatory protein